MGTRPVGRGFASRRASRSLRGVGRGHDRAPTPGLFSSCHSGGVSGDGLADDVDGVEPADEEHRREGQQQEHRQGKDRARRDQHVGLGVVAGVAGVAHASAVPFGAHGAVWSQRRRGVVVGSAGGGS